MFPLLGGLISAGSSLLGGLMNSSSQQAINAQNIQAQEMFAQNGIQWKVADARKAGINPLAALGAQTASFSNNVGSDALGNSVANAGQDIGRAVAAQSTADDRQFLEQQRAQTLQRGDLENALIASQIRTLNQPGNPPPMQAPGTQYLAPGQASSAVPGSSSSISVRPAEVTASSPDPRVTAAVVPEVEMSRGPGGSLVPIPGKDVQNMSFGSHLAPFMWDLRNIVGPTFTSRMDPQLPPPKDGYQWSYSPVSGYFQVPVLWDARKWWEGR